MESLCEVALLCECSVAQLGEPCGGLSDRPTGMTYIQSDLYVGHNGTSSSNTGRMSMFELANSIILS